MLAALNPLKRAAQLVGARTLLSSASLFPPTARPPPNYPGHIPLTTPERALLAVGSAVGSLLNPRRGDLIAALGEATATPYFIYRLRDAMLADPTGRRILRDRPRITSKTMSMEMLRALPDGTVGREYAAWLDKEGVSPDTRSQVRYIDDPECAYIMQRYRESHDFYHALTGLPIIVEGEIALKAFEFFNTLIPMTGLSMFAFVRLKRSEQQRILTTYFPWAVRNGLLAREVINIYWEEELLTGVEALRERIGLEKPLDLRGVRREERRRRRKEEERRKAGVVG
ncbi:uncharacterized protein H6S33_002500 [Morchella sextelata]|uniref:uncharacterized protein n=1 Tax=Morchella sextelata TaxID=1174677 RepID=UPI001D03FC8A|nr:uncharacterized protein H6S33_002500 [Morchella sextelata]KAH0607466.1 hypothetical protein H6S33_002500 [Morchella sextelata]